MLITLLKNKCVFRNYKIYIYVKCLQLFSEKHEEVPLRFKTISPRPKIRKVVAVKVWIYGCCQNVQHQQIFEFPQYS